MKNKKKQIKYTKEEINNIFFEKEIETIAKEYSKNDVEQMYITLTEDKPLSSYNKIQIIKNIDARYKKINRAKNIYDK